MPQAKTAATKPKAASVKKSRPAAARAAKPTATPSNAPAGPRKRTVKSKPVEAPTVGSTEATEVESLIVAAKFKGAKPAKRKTVPKPTLPTTYSESRLLLLPRDPQTLFAAWDLAPDMVSALKARIGARALAVSSFTLHLSRAGEPPSVIHLGKKARSKYIPIDGGPSFTAEIGLTTPTGAFEPIARSGVCFVPMGAARQQATEGLKRSTLSYRETRAMVRRGLLRSAAGRVRSALARDAAGAVGVAPVAARTLGGASDLYRR